MTSSSAGTSKRYGGRKSYGRDRPGRTGIAGATGISTVLIGVAAGSVLASMPTTYQTPGGVAIRTKPNPEGL